MRMTFLCVFFDQFQDIICPEPAKVDLIRTVTLPHLQLFGISEGLELRVRLPPFNSTLVADKFG